MTLWRLGPINLAEFFIILITKGTEVMAVQDASFNVCKISRSTYVLIQCYVRSDIYLYLITVHMTSPFSPQERWVTMRQVP